MKKKKKQRQQQPERKRVKCLKIYSWRPFECNENRSNHVLCCVCVFFCLFRLLRSCFSMIERAMSSSCSLVTQFKYSLLAVHFIHVLVFWVNEHTHTHTQKQPNNNNNTEHCDAMRWISDRQNEWKKKTDFMQKLWSKKKQTTNQPDTRDTHTQIKLLFSFHFYFGLLREKEEEKRETNYNVLRLTGTQCNFQMNRSIIILLLCRCIEAKKKEWLFDFEYQRYGCCCFWAHRHLMHWINCDCII